MSNSNKPYTCVTFNTWEVPNQKNLYLGLFVQLLNGRIVADKHLLAILLIVPTAAPLKAKKMRCY